jgi:cobalt-zinc-cadmium efflux system protein
MQHESHVHADAETGAKAVGCGHAHHSHAPKTGRAFAVSVVLNGLFVVVELVIGALAGSVALVADAAHNFGDVVALFLGWGALRLAKRKPSEKRTYGFRRATILASVANAMLLVLAVGAVAVEAIGRLRVPAAPHALPMLAVAAVGIVINGGSALLFLRGRKRDTNARGAFIHLLGDAAVSVGVVVAGAVIYFTGWTWIDPVASLVVSAVILVSTWRLLRDALNLALDAVPMHIDPNEVKAFLTGCPDILAVHDLHIWALSTTETALTAHLVSNRPSSALREIARALEKKFEIHHTTLQLEPPSDCVGC